MASFSPIYLDKLPFHRGTYTPKIIFVGEAAGSDEDNDQHPHTPYKRAFIGASGQLQDDKIQRAGINIDDCYFTNVYKIHPERNKIDLWLKDPQNDADAEVYRKILTAELRYLSQFANLIVPVGAKALEVITGKSSIENYRGSIIPATMEGIRGMKCIPIIHPAAILRAWKSLVAYNLDLQRISEECKFPEIILPQRTYLIRPTFELVLTKLKEYENSTELLSVDIETIRTRPNRIVSIQFAISPFEGLTIPFQHKDGKPYWSQEQESIIWREIAKLLTGCGRRIVGQNFSTFDTFMLHHYGISYDTLLSNILIDTMEGWQCYQPDLPKGLDFLCSIYTKEPFYKSEGKEWGHKEGEDEFWTYGAKDVCVTHEIAPLIMKDLKDNNLWDFYIQRYRDVAHPRMNMSLKGLKVNTKVRDKVGAEITRDCLREQAKLTLIVGENINVKSTPKMRDLLYVKMKLPKQWKDERLTADEDALLKLSTRDASPIFGHILKIRHHRTIYSNNIMAKLDSDGMLRTSFNFAATGRFTSFGCPFHTGANLQNITKVMRDMFIPEDPSLVFIQMDLSQAEARVVYWRARDYRMIRMFLSGADIHSNNAAYIFRKDLADIKKDGPERYAAKRIVHACDYGMRAPRFAQVYNKDAAEIGLPLIDVKTANEYLEGFHELAPNLRNVYHKELKEQVQKNKTIYNPFCRRMVFHDRLGDELYKQVYAAYAQSAVADLTNTILMKLYKILDVRLQIHDALLVQCHKNDIDLVVSIMLEAAQIPIHISDEYGIEPLVIPADVEVGESWYRMEKYKPTKKAA